MSIIYKHMKILTRLHPSALDILVNLKYSRSYTISSLVFRPHQSSYSPTSSYLHLLTPSAVPFNPSALIITKSY